MQGTNFKRKPSIALVNESKAVYHSGSIKREMRTSNCRVGRDVRVQNQRISNFAFYSSWISADSAAFYRQLIS